MKVPDSYRRITQTNGQVSHASFTQVVRSVIAEVPVFFPTFRGRFLLVFTTAVSLEFPPANGGG